MNRSLVSVEREYVVGRVDRSEIPESKRALLAAGGQPAPVGGKRSRAGGHFVPMQWTPPDCEQLRCRSACRRHDGGWAGCAALER